MSPRYCDLDKYERYVEGTQYDGRAPFLSQAEGAPPLLERAPNIVYPVVANAIRSNSDFVLGEGRWPTIVAPRDDEGLSEDDAAALEKIVARVVEQAKLKSVTRDALDTAQAVGSVASVCSVRFGRLHVENVKAQWCEPTFDPRGHVVRLVVTYPYLATEYDATKKAYVECCKVYRRVIDATADVVHEPIDAKLALAGVVGAEASRVEHGLGFCPVVWYALLKPTSCAHSFDGHPIHKGLLDEIDALNFALSQRHRAAIYSGDPQIYEVGVDAADRGPSGQTASVTTEKGYFSTTAPRRKAKRKGAGVVWSYDNPNAKVGLLTLPGDALKALDDHARDLKAKVHESLAVVDVDVENAKLASDVSGKALEILFRRQLDRCNKIREDFGDGYLLAVVLMLLRVALVVGRANGGVYLPGLASALKLLATFERRVAGRDDREWFGPQLDLVWGPYFRPSDSDTKAAVESVKLALEARAISRRQAVEKLKPHFPFWSADEVLAAIASTPTVEEALQVQAFGVGSPTFDKLYRGRLAASLLGPIDEMDATAIANEVEQSAPTADAMRPVDRVSTREPDEDEDEPEES